MESHGSTWKHKEAQGTKMKEHKKVGSTKRQNKITLKSEEAQGSTRKHKTEKGRKKEEKMKLHITRIAETYHKIVFFINFTVASYNGSEISS